MHEFHKLIFVKHSDIVSYFLGIVAALPCWYFWVQNAMFGQWHRTRGFAPKTGFSIPFWVPGVFL